MTPTDAQVRWGIAATGHIAERFATALSEVDDAALVAVASRDAARAEAFGDTFGVPRRHGSYEALAGDPEVDVVYVASPQHRHAPDSLLFLDAGKHLLCEKPFALNQRQATLVAATARRAGRFAMEAMWTRFLPAYRALRRILDDGTIGTPRLVEGDFGFRMRPDPHHRLFDLALGGGALLDLGVYPVQLDSFVLGTPDAVAAAAHLGSTGVDEQVAAVLHHPGGGLGVVKAAITTPLSCTARIAGTDGTVALPAFMHCPDHLVVARSGAEERVDASFTGEGLRFQVHEVHECLREGRLESATMPLDETCAIAGTLDAAREQIGLRYPGEA